MRPDKTYNIKGKQLPSVTTILSILSKGEGLLRWFGALGTEEAERIKEEAAIFGSRIHNILERIGKGEKINMRDLKEREKRCVRAFLEWIKDNDVHFLKTEHTVYTDQYAGTLDAVIMKEEKTYIIDYKTSSRLYKENDLQLVAYLSAYEKMHNTIIDGAYILRFEKNLEKKKPMEVREIKHISECIDIFLAVLKIYKWKKGGSNC